MSKVYVLIESDPHYPTIIHGVFADRAHADSRSLAGGRYFYVEEWVVTPSFGFRIRNAIGDFFSRLFQRNRATSAEVTVHYDWGAHTSTWKKDDDTYCPNCGNKSVWFNASSSFDYEWGQQHLCTACGANFHLPSGSFPSEDEHDKQRLTQLRAK